MEEAAPVFIATAELDRASFCWLNGLRQRHFPRERNYLDAHLTLFHKLDEAGVRIVRQTVAERLRGPVAVRFTGLRKLGRGVAIEVDAPDLIAIRTACARALSERLSRQDSQGFRPHVTVQNKVEPHIANELYGALIASFAQRQGEIGAVQIWRYLGGPWQFVERFACDGRQLANGL